MTHTEGPWRAEKDTTGYYRIVPTHHVYGVDEDGNEKVVAAFCSEEDAPILSAAPRMLEALRLGVEADEAGMAVSVNPSPANIATRKAKQKAFREAARAAIAQTEEKDDE